MHIIASVCNCMYVYVYVCLCVCANLTQVLRSRTLAEAPSNISALTCLDRDCASLWLTLFVNVYVCL